MLAASSVPGAGKYCRPMIPIYVRIRNQTDSEHLTCPLSLGHSRIPEALLGVDHKSLATTTEGSGHLRNSASCTPRVSLGTLTLLGHDLRKEKQNIRINCTATVLGVVIERHIWRLFICGFDIPSNPCALPSQSDFAMYVREFQGVRKC